MRFKLGLALGFAAGYWYGTLPEEERKQRLDEALDKVKGNPRLQRVTDTVSRNAAKVTDAVEERVVGTADRAGDAVASKVPAPPSDDDDEAAATFEKLPGTGVG